MYSALYGSFPASSQRETPCFAVWMFLSSSIHSSISDQSTTFDEFVVDVWLELFDKLSAAYIHAELDEIDGRFIFILMLPLLLTTLALSCNNGTVESLTMFEFHFFKSQAFVLICGSFGCCQRFSPVLLNIGCPEVFVKVIFGLCVISLSTLFISSSVFTFGYMILMKSLLFSV